MKLGAEGEVERLVSEWGFVLRQFNRGRPPSRAHLHRLLVEPGMPEWATPQERQLVRRTLDQGPGVRTIPEPEDWFLFGILTPQQAQALFELWALHAELAAYSAAAPGGSRTSIRTNCLVDAAQLNERMKGMDLITGGHSAQELEAIWRELCQSVSVDLRYVESRGTWKVRSPKEQARNIVARRHHVSPETLKTWERGFKDSPEWVKGGAVFGMLGISPPTR